MKKVAYLIAIIISVGAIGTHQVHALSPSNSQGNSPEEKFTEYERLLEASLKNSDKRSTAKYLLYILKIERDTDMARDLLERDHASIPRPEEEQTLTVISQALRSLVDYKTVVDQKTGMIDQVITTNRPTDYAQQMLRYASTQVKPRWTDRFNQSE